MTKKEKKIIEVDSLLELEKKLSDKELKFCRKYVITRNRIQSAMEAGYSKTTAKQWAYRVANRPQVKAYISEAFRLASEQFVMTAEEILARHAEIAFMDIADYVTNENGILEVKELDKVDTTLIKKIKQSKYGIEVEFEDRSKSLDVLTRYLGIYSDNAIDLSPNALANVLKYYTPNQMAELMDLLNKK